MKYGQRLKAARKHANLTQEELAEQLEKMGAKITQAGISYLEKSETATGSELTVHFAFACGVRPEWLAFEQGEMVNVVAPPIAHTMEVMKAMCPEQQYLVARLADQVAEPKNAEKKK